MPDHILALMMLGMLVGPPLLALGTMGMVAALLGLPPFRKSASRPEGARQRQTSVYSARE
jgi:hypothetical protein